MREIPEAVELLLGQLCPQAIFHQGERVEKSTLQGPSRGVSLKVGGQAGAAAVREIEIDAWNLEVIVLARMNELREARERDLARDPGLAQRIAESL